MKEIEDKNDALVAQGEYYEALQGYKTLARRLDLAEQHAERHDLLVRAASKLVAQERWAEATELAVMAISTAPAGDSVRAGAKLYKDYVAQLERWRASHPDAEMPPTAYAALRQMLTAGIDRTKAQYKALHPTDEQTKRVEYQGAPELHGLLAEALLEEGCLAEALAHYARGGDHVKTSQAVVDVFKLYLISGRPDQLLDPNVSEAIAVLELCAIGDLDGANRVLSLIQSEIPISARPTGSLKLHQFIRFLLPTLERQAHPLFAELERRYASNIDLLVDGPKLLTSIDYIYFGHKRAPTGMAAMLNSMMGMFGGRPTSPSVPDLG